MSQKMRIACAKLRRPVVTASLMVAAIQAAYPATTTWVGGDSFWDIASNWDIGIPGLNDDAALGVANTTFRLGSLSIRSFVGSGQLSLTGGTLQVSDGSSVGSLIQSAGTLAGGGTLNVAGASTWTGGTMSGSGVTNFNGALAINGNGPSRLISGRTVNFNGTTTWTNFNNPFAASGPIGTANGATLNNTGTWLDQVSRDINITSTGTGNTFNNSGSYIKSGGLGYTNILPVFNNTATGSVTVNNGTLYLSGGGSLTNAIDVASGAALNLNAGTFAVSGITAGTGTGALNITGSTTNATGTNAFAGTLGIFSGTLNVAGSFAAGGYTQSGGTLEGGGTLNVAGASTWTGGTMSGSGVTNFNGALAINGNGPSRLISGRTVNFNGTTTWTNFNNPFAASGPIGTANGATLNNTGTWLDQVSRDINITSTGTASTFNNSGSYIKSGPANTDLSALRLINAGVIDVQTASLRLPASFVNDGTLMGSGTFITNALINKGHVAPGESPGTLHLAGNYIQDSAGSLDIELQGLSKHDLFMVAGSASLNGRLSLICFDDCNLAVGQSFKILDANPNLLTGTFSAVVLSGFSTGDFTVIYDVPNGDVWLNAITKVTPAVPEPGTWALFISGAFLISALRRRSQSRQPSNAQRAVNDYCSVGGLPAARRHR